MHRSAKLGPAKARTPAALLPKSKRYDSVQSSLDTGASITKARAKPARCAVLKRMDESFARLTVAQLYELLVEAEVPRPRVDGGACGVGAEGRAAASGEPRRVVYGADDEPEFVAPLLLVDVRDRADFEDCHIMTAMCCSALDIRQERIPREIAQLRGRPTAKLVLYDEGEEAAPDVAHRFTTRGFTNVFVLSGGLRAVARRSPLLIDGPVPDWLVEAVSPEAVEFRLKQNHWFPEPSKSDRDAWEGLDVLERDRMVASAARLAFFRGTVERKPVPVRELKRLAGKHGKAIKSMLVREVQRYLRKALGLDFVPAVGLPVPVKGKRTLDHSLEARRDWKQLIVVSRQALSGRLLDPAGTAVADVDAKTAAGVSRVERARRGVLMTCLALIAMGPKQTLPEAELYSLLLQVDPDIALSVGPDWEATVKRWLSEAGAAKVATVTDELPSGATETRRIYCLESGARASVGGMAVASFAAQVGRPGRTPDLARWLGDEALADPEVPGEGGWSDDEGAGAGAAAGHAAAAPPTASAGLTQPSAAGAAAAEAAALPDRRTRSKRARAEAEASGAAGEGRRLRRRR